MKPIWIEEYIKSVAYSVVLADYSTDTSRRQAFILLDNSFEQYMSESIVIGKHKKNDKIRNSFYQLLKEYSSISSFPDSEFDKVMEFHNIRNEMYHNKNYLFVSESGFSDYLSLVKKHSEYNDENLEQEFDLELAKIREEARRKERNNRSDRKWRTMSTIKDIVIDEFDLRGNDYVGDFMLSSPIGISHLVSSEIQQLIQGYVKCSNDKIRLLEIIESNEENSFHSFFLNTESSTIWKCYIDSTWSKYGKGEDFYIQKVRSIAEKYNDRVEHRIAYMLPGHVKRAFSDEEY